MTDKDAMDNIRALHCGDYNCQLPDNELDDPDFWCKSKNCEGCFNYLCYTALQARIAGQQQTNPPLTLEELKSRKSPVWSVVDDCSWIPDGGYYCLCDCGVILPPSIRPHSAEECLEHGWVFLGRKPEEGPVL